MSKETTRHTVRSLFGLAPPTDPSRFNVNIKIDGAEGLIRRPSFTPFATEDAERAGALSVELGAIADAAPSREEGLERASEAAAAAAAINPGLARHAFGLFATHHPRGKGAPIPTVLERLAFAASEDAGGLVAGAAAAETTLGSGATGQEAVLDWFREDPLSNEHHEHWHWVYPNNVDGYAKPRHGELFYYMHQQMLARYDVERISAGLPIAVPLTDFEGPVGEGYDPGKLVTSMDYFPRAADAIMVDVPEYGMSRTLLTGLDGLVARAATERALTNGQDTVALNGHEGSDLLGRETEPNGLRRFGAVYQNHHGTGHVVISAASSERWGVMYNPDSAIRDPVFWRWHRRVDDLHFLYQDQLAPNPFNDAPATSITGLSAGPRPADASGLTPADRSAAADAILADTGAVELRTEMRKGRFRLVDQHSVFTYDYLAHEPFGVAIAIDNPNATPASVTLRLFLLADDLMPTDRDLSGLRQARRFVIELDKVKLDASPGRSTHLRADVDMSVLRRPAVINPDEVADELGEDHPQTVECSCGWPYTLLLPRGNAAGMPFHLFAMLTDNQIDKVGSAKACGSMSFCGVGDDYPDSRAMGYPFDRPIAGTLQDLVDAHPEMALTPLTIRWTNPPQGPS